VETLLFVSGSDILNRESQHRNVVIAAKEAGVRHVVYTSFQGNNETDTSPLWMVAKSHLQTEAWLKESGMDHTILKNTLYMDFVPAFIGDQVLETGVIYLPAGQGNVGAVLRSEMAEATAHVLASSDHAGKTYRFTHQEAFSYQDVAQHLSDITGKTIQYISPTADEYAHTLTELGVPAAYIGLFSSFAVAQANGELDTVGSDLERLLGRKPTDVKTFLAQVYSPS
jgi:NAD(P)H dehydrogenase (quinone)